MKRTVQMKKAGIPVARVGAPIPFKKVGTKGLKSNMFNAPMHAGLAKLQHGLFGRMDWSALNDYLAKQQADKKAKAARFLKKAA